MNLKSFIIEKECSVLEAMQKLDRNGYGIVFICEQEKLLASIQDQEIRKHLLKGGSLQDNVLLAANLCPETVSVDQQFQAEELLKNKKTNAVVVTDHQKKIFSVLLADGKQLRSYDSLKIPVVFTTRETGDFQQDRVNKIIERFLSFGCDEFFIMKGEKRRKIASFTSSKATMHIEDVFSLGTGAALKQLKGKINGTFFVSAKDTIINARYDEILEKHKSEDHLVTMICAIKNLGIPYDTVELDREGIVSAVHPRPQFTFFVDAGLYIIEPEFLDKIPDDRAVSIESAIRYGLRCGEKIRAWLIPEGCFQEFNRL